MKLKMLLSIVEMTNNLITLLEDRPFLIARNLRKGIEATIGAQAFPSLIGTDFLTNMQLALYFNPAKNMVYLEKE